MIDFAAQFDAIRPYNDSEANAAIRRMIGDEQFKYVARFVYPEQAYEEVCSRLASITTIHDFQVEFSHKAVEQIVATTTNGVTTGGLEGLNCGQSYLFVANHRDIVLDSALMQVILHDHGHRTSQITFGSNLMSSPMIIDFGKLNKMFRFNRSTSRLQIYKDALLHSAYIRHVLTELNESVWIAQRNGRTKDGDDQTQSSLIKMFTAGEKDYYTTIKALNIVPVSISYEIEPCDLQKVCEKHIAESSTYVKQENEDLESIISGLISPKGRIHMQFGKPLNTHLDQINKQSGSSLNDFAEAVAKQIDRQIYRDYKLWGNNYVAFDVMNQSEEYLGKTYDLGERERFTNYIEQRLSQTQSDKDVLRQMLIKLYAMPVVNARKTSTTDQH